MVRAHSAVCTDVDNGPVSTASFPLRGINDVDGGAIGFAWDKTMAFTPDLVAHLETLVSTTEQALSRAEALETERSTRRQITIVDNVLRRLTDALTVADVACGVVDQLSALEGIDDVVVVDSTGRVLARSPADEEGGPLRPDHPALIALACGAEWAVDASQGTVAQLAGPLRAGTEIVGAFAMSGHGALSERRLCRSIADVAANALSRARLFDVAVMTAELLQRSLLPQQLPDLDGYAFGAHYQPASAAHQIGGDWYDIVQLDGDRVALVIGDVAGHGIASAGLMGRLRHIVEACAAIVHTPDSLLDHVERVLRSTPGNMATLLYLVLDTVTGEMIWRSAGHPPALLQAADGTSRHLVGGLRPPLGFGLTTPAGSAHGSELLYPGETIILYTDGLIERRTESLDIGLERLRAHVSGRHLDLSTLDAQIVEPVAGTQPPDDIAILAVRRNERQSPGQPYAAQRPQRQQAVSRRTVHGQSSPRSLRDELRRETLDQHQALDRSIEHLRPFDALEQYAEMLSRHLHARRRITTMFDGLAAGPHWLSRTQRVQDGLEADLKLLGVPHTPLHVDPIEEPATALGIMYVLEGSLLGSQILARSAIQAFGPHVPLRFLRTDDVSHRWKAAVQELEAFNGRTEPIIRAARQTFDVHISEFAGAAASSSASLHGQPPA